jgi:hypothetical protein
MVSRAPGVTGRGFAFTFTFSLRAAVALLVKLAWWRRAERPHLLVVRRFPPAPPSRML